jgi:hypothetical protein
MTDSLKLRTFSGWSILLLGILLSLTSLLPVLSRGSLSPAAGMIGLFGLLAVGVGLPFSATPAQRLTEGAARNLCVGLESLILGAAGGVFGFCVQRSPFLNIRDPLPGTVVVVFVALFCFAALARVAMARAGSAAFRSSSPGLFSCGGSMDPVLFLVLQPSLLVLAAVAGRMIVAQAGDGREGSMLALAPALAVLPIFVRAELALWARRRRDTSAAWPSYGVLAWAALLGLMAFPEMLRWLLSLPGVLFGSSPLSTWPQVSLIQVFGYLTSLAVCVSFYIASRRARRAFSSRALGYVALAVGTLLPVAVGLASEGVRAGPPIPIAVVLAVMLVLPAALIIPAHHLLFTREKKPAGHHAEEVCHGIASLASVGASTVNDAASALDAPAPTEPAPGEYPAPDPAASWPAGISADEPQLPQDEHALTP